MEQEPRNHSQDYDVVIFLASYPKKGDIPAAASISYLWREYHVTGIVPLDQAKRRDAAERKVLKKAMASIEQDCLRLNQDFSRLNIKKSKYPY